MAPFDASLVLLVVGGALIAAFWKENYGDAAHAAGSIPTGFDNFSKAWRILVSNEKV